MTADDVVDKCPPMFDGCAVLLVLPIAAICRCERLRSRDREVMLLLVALLRVVSDFRCCDDGDGFTATLTEPLVPAVVPVAKETAGATDGVDSLHEDRLDSLPCDAVSETKLCVSSKPSSFKSC